MYDIFLEDIITSYNVLYIYYYRTMQHITIEAPLCVDAYVFTKIVRIFWQSGTIL